MTFLYIILGIVGVFVVFVIGMRIALTLKSARLKGKSAPQLHGKQGKHIAKGLPALFYFYSPGCGACKAMTPVVKKMEKNQKGVFAIDISKDMATAQKFGVMATPTTIIIKKGIVQDVLIGPQPPAQLNAII